MTPKCHCIVWWHFICKASRIITEYYYNYRLTNVAEYQHDYDSHRWKNYHLDLSDVDLYHGANKKRFRESYLYRIVCSAFRAGRCICTINPNKTSLHRRRHMVSNRYHQRDCVLASHRSIVKRSQCSI